MRARPLLATLCLTTLLGACCPPAAVTGPGTIPIVTTTPPVVAPTPRAAPAGVALDTLQPGVSVHGFTPSAVYLDGADHPVGARFVHDRTRFTFDYLRIESAPQGFIWVNSYPTSDRGEPHTQEHLLLGKGNRGRKMGSFQAMALAESSAFTDQWYTAYHFHTVAAPETFWPVLGDQLGALLDPDYTDDEIRREVRNFGVDSGPKGALRLEEKGTVYNEMVRSYEPADRIVWRAALQQIYGAQHPLAFESGGYPDAIRTMTAEHIRAFHAANYHLANMGMIGAFPSSMPLADVLDHASMVLGAATQRTGTVTTAADLPAPAPQPATLTTVDYPYSDASQASPMMLAWPASRGSLDLAERTLLDLFLGAFAGDETTNLYKRLVDSKTRELDTGASSVSAYQSPDQGHPILLTIDGVHADKLDAVTLGKVRALVLSELRKLAALPAGDPQLVAFDARVQSRAIDQRRQLAKFLDSPPGFGIRGTGSGWMYQLVALASVPGFQKSLTLKPQLAAIDTILAARGNPWSTRLQAWGLLETPHAIVARPSPALRKQLDQDRDGRIAAELARLGTQYGTTTPAATLARYRTDYDATTAALDAASRATPLPPLVATAPMTLDDGLPYTQGTVGRAPLVAVTIDSMQSSRIEVAFSLADRIAEDDLVYLAALPQLISEVGIADGATIISSEDMHERMRKEILGVDVAYAESTRTRRSELVIAGSGNDAGETRLAIGWMTLMVRAPDWRLENLPRLRDVVDQALTETRQRMQGAEESWVKNPHDAWWLQDWALHLHTRSFLTRAHDLHRIRWQLLDPRDPAVTAEAATFLATLATAQKQPRVGLLALAATLAGSATAKAPAGVPAVIAAWKALSPGAKRLATEAGKDLVQLIPTLPDGSLAADWAYLCRQMAHDLGVGAPSALARLAAVRAAIVGSSARVVTLGSTASHRALAGDLAALVAALPASTVAAPSYPAHRYVTERLAAHDPTAAQARYVGLFAPQTSSGVFVNSAPSTAITDTGHDQVLDYLASNLYTGHGAHSLFMKTWAAGLAYSNGVHPLLSEGQVEYYAERCPLLPQTMGFVIDQLRHAQPDDNIARYAIAIAFDSRVAEPYEARATAMAEDLADGVTPAVVRAFRQQLLAQASQPDLAAQLFARMQSVYAKVMPGYGNHQVSGPGQVSFVIGPAKQLDAYQTYLRAAVGSDAALHRLYPRDFWIPAKL